MSNNGAGGSGPLLPAAKLWAKTSGKGKRYLVGRWGGVKVLILENRDRQNENDPTHVLCIAAAPDRQQQQQGAARSSSGQRGNGYGARDQYAPGNGGNGADRGRRGPPPQEAHGGGDFFDDDIPL
jgi:hypothetical protein